MRKGRSASPKPMSPPNPPPPPPRRRPPFSSSPPSTHARIERPMRRLDLSTEVTRTCTSCPTLSTSSTLPTPPSWICEMCTRPSTPSLIVTKAPKSVIVLTLPVMNSFGSALSNSVRSTLGLRARGAPPPARGSLHVSASWLFSRLTAFTLQVMLSPTLSFSVASLTNSLEISETCSRPSVDAPMSTKAPYDITDLILPSTSAPTSSCSSGVLLPLAAAGASAAAAGASSATAAGASASSAGASQR
mmetsp:Transcript_29955/g.77582  ORF Transcript_29955/g.77582 Transcript_29955/m.77582 type:complete len:246 (+) Transcript_29955:502-1239(+)